VWPAPLNNIGVLLNAEGRPTEAVTYFRHALGLDPDDAIARGNLKALGQPTTAPPRSR